jgi:hemerythrin superfamily protein
MNAIDLLKEDHRLVEYFFQQVEDTTRSKYPAIFSKIKDALDTHAHIEEKIFYPRLKKDGKKDLVEIVREGLEEHRQIKKFLREIAALNQKNDQYEAKIQVLIEDTRHHVKEEENEMFPLVRDQFSSEALDRLGDRMQAEKEKYQKANGIKPPRIQKAKGPLAKIFNAMGEAASNMLSAEKDGGPKRSRTGKPKKTSSRPTGKNGSSARSNTGKGSTPNVRSVRKVTAAKASPGPAAKASAK